MTQFNVKGAWTDRNGRRHNFEIQTDSADRSLIKDIVESQYPAERVVINSVRQRQ